MTVEFRQFTINHAQARNWTGAWEGQPPLCQF